jgi:hypothetical protein
MISGKSSVGFIVLWHRCCFPNLTRFNSSEAVIESGGFFRWRSCPWLAVGAVAQLWDSLDARREHVPAVNARLRGKMKTVKEQTLKELAETLKNLGEDHLEEKGEILHELSCRRLNFESELELEIGEVFAKAVRELTAVLDNLQVS